MSLREFASAHNAPVSTLSGWFQDVEPASPATLVDDEDVESVSQGLQRLLLRQARAVLESMPLKDSQGQQQAAAAADKLIANALKLGGLNQAAEDERPGAGVPDTVSEAELDVLLGIGQD